MWLKTRTWSLVDVPISLSKNTRYVTADLPVNWTARYSIEIYAKNVTPPDRLQCELGASFPHQTCDVREILRMHWSVESEDKTIQGISDETVGLGGGGPGPLGANRTIGIFKGGKGHHYKIETDVLSDSENLNVASPRLYVGVYDSSMESALFMYGFAKAAYICAIVAGVVMITTSQLHLLRLDSSTSGQGG